MSSKVPAPKRPVSPEVETRRDFLDFVQEHRKGLVAAGALLALAVVGIILFFTQKHFRAAVEKQGIG